MNKTTEAFDAWWADEGEQSLFALNTTTDDDIKILAGIAWEAATREALAEPEITTPDVCGEVCARAKLCYGCGKSLDEANAKLAEPYACEAGECPDRSLCAGACECLFKAEPVKQEPVAAISESAIGLVKLHSNGACLPFGTQLYAAPVSAEAIRAEALEEAEEIAKTIGGSFSVEFLAAIRGLK